MKSSTEMNMWDKLVPHPHMAVKNQKGCQSFSDQALHHRGTRRRRRRKQGIGYLSEDQQGNQQGNSGLNDT